jgi:hypothetical protein
MGVGQFCIGDAAPVVSYVKHKAAGLLLEGDMDDGCLSMSSHIRQDFVKNSEHGRRAGMGQCDRAQVDVERTLNPCACLKFMGLPFDGRDEAELIEDDRAQLCGDPLDRLDRPIDQCGNRLQLFSAS